MDTILVSNRIVDPMRSGGAMPGGLAAALAAAVRDSGATWIGGNSERQGAESGAVTVTPFGSGTLAKVTLPAAIYRQFYDGMANAALWPILHYRTDLLRYQPDFLAAYSAINSAMADGVRRIASDESVIWVHDYHCFMLGRYLRQRGVRGPIGFFLHTPFPHRSILTCLPCHRELLRELCAYDLIGFQTDEDLLHFRDYATSELFGTMVGQTELQLGGRRVHLGVFPIGIDVDRFGGDAERAVATSALKRLRHVLSDSRLVIGVDRLDYSKGLVHRFHAYRRFFSDYPDERRRVSFLQITSPTREKVEAYRTIRAELASIAGETNAHFSGAAWVALRYIHEGFAPERLSGYYRVARVGCVTPLRDGMNLVAKEYVASQDPEDPGVLVLSMFAGAASQMGAALLVNPYDTVGVARRIHEALYMPKEERIERWNALMRTLRNSDLDGWFNSFLGALQACSLPVGQIARLSVA